MSTPSSKGENRWGTPSALTWFLAATGFIVGWLMWENRIPHPMLDPALFHRIPFRLFGTIVSSATDPASAARPISFRPKLRRRSDDGIGGALLVAERVQRPDCVDGLEIGIVDFDDANDPPISPTIALGRCDPGGHAARACV